MEPHVVIHGGKISLLFYLENDGGGLTGSMSHQPPSHSPYESYSTSHVQTVNVTEAHF